MFKLIFISRFFSGLSRGDYVTHSVPSVTETEGGQVTLDSNYATTLSDYCLYWYRQLSEKQPEYILRSCTVLPEHKAAFAQSRFSVELQTSRTSNKLTISQLELSDSAVYYCRPPRTKTLLALCGGAEASSLFPGNVGPVSQKRRSPQVNLSAEVPKKYIWYSRRISKSGENKIKLINFPCNSTFKINNSNCLKHKIRQMLESEKKSEINVSDRFGETE
uniref:Ig-like domain-containing protein n=1 Tax=Callorhinchus milii TaxID=7868 RepID=A0A4W3IBB2_CALMI